MEANKVFFDFIKTVFLAKDYLTGQKGQRKDPDAKDYIRYTWSDYCEEIGVSRQNIDSWLRNSKRAKQLSDLPVPPGFAAAVWWFNRQKKKPSAGNPRGRRQRGRA